MKRRFFTLSALAAATATAAGLGRPATPLAQGASLPPLVSLVVPFAPGGGADQLAREFAAAAAALLPEAGTDPWIALRGFRANAAGRVTLEVAVAGETRLMTLAGPAPAATIADGVLFRAGEAWPFGPPDHAAGAGGGEGDGAVAAPMPGRIIAVLVAEGASVAKGDRLLVMEAMKMEQALLAPFDGVVVALSAGEGDQVVEGTTLVRVERA